MDYAAWVGRAKSFIRGMAHLPGEVDLVDGIEPPANHPTDKEWLDSGSCSLPAVVREFLRTASRRCYLSFRWVPPESIRSRHAALFLDRSELSGGGDLCEASRFRNFDHRDWYRNHLPEMMRQTAESYPIQISSFDIGQAITSSLEEIGKDDARGENGLTLLEMKDEKSLVLELDSEKGPGPVRFVDRQDPANNRFMAAGFEEFLRFWEEVCYLTPDPAVLAPWLESEEGLPRPDHRKLAMLRRLLTGTEGSP